MISRSIEEQLEILRTTTERVGVSREAAADFLRSAGIDHYNDASRERAAYPTKDGRRAKREAASGKFVSRTGLL